MFFFVLNPDLALNAQASRRNLDIRTFLLPSCGVVFGSKHPRPIVAPALIWLRAVRHPGSVCQTASGDLQNALRIRMDGCRPLL